MSIHKTSLSLLSSLLLLCIVGCSKNESASKPEETKAAPLAMVKIDPATTGAITGVIKFAGTAPKADRIDMSQDPACAMGASPLYSEAYQVKAGKLENVYVYVKDGLPAGTFETPKAAVVIDQKGCRYLPHVTGAMVNQKVRVLNSDPTMHNVHPSPELNHPWNISQQPMGEPVEESFKRPEQMIKISCNQHPWMRMYLNVSAHPFFAVSGSDGKFEINGLPPGEYTIAAVHEKLGEQTMKVTVETKKASMAEFEFSRKN